MTELDILLRIESSLKGIFWLLISMYLIWLLFKAFK